MLILDATTRSLEIDLNGAITTNQLPFVASYVDLAKTTSEVVASSMNTGQSNSTTAVTLVAAPGANQTRHLKYLSIRNADTVSTVLWIQVNDNSTLREIWKGTLAVGDSLVYTDSLGFNIINTSGQIKTTTATAGIGTIGSSTDNALVRWDGTGGTNIQDSSWTLSDTHVLTAAGNVALGANYISRAGTAAGLSLDASNNATLSGTLTASGTGTSTISGPLAISGTSAGQIVFPATQNPSAGANTLDDYEEAPWTPANPQVSLTVTSAVYTKIGNKVAFQCRVTWPANADATAATITGLPFTVGAQDYPVLVYSNGVDTAAYISASANTIGTIINSATGVALTNTALAGITLRISGIYFV